MKTVKDLKDYLNNLSPEMDDASLFSVLSIGCCGETLELGDMEIDHFPPEKEFKGFVRFMFNDKIPGYRTCRQVGQTINNDKQFKKE